MEPQVVIKNDDTSKIKCSNCNKTLMIIPSYEKGHEVLFEVTVDCPFCGDHSYQYNVTGPLRYHFAEGVKYKSMEHNTGNAPLKVRFKTVKG